MPGTRPAGPRSRSRHDDPQRPHVHETVDLLSAPARIVRRLVGMFCSFCVPARHPYPAELRPLGRGVRVQTSRREAHYRLPVMATERGCAIEDRTVRVRTAGDPAGFPVMYFHGTPGSRLDLAFGDELIAAMGVRLVSFDRPGYGGSSPSPFGLLSVPHGRVDHR